MTLKARRRFKYHGHPVAKGDLLDPEPEGRLRTALVDGGFAEEYHGNLQVAEPPAPPPPAPTPPEPVAEAEPVTPPAKKAPARKAAAKSKKSTAKATKRPPAREPATAR